MGSEQEMGFWEMVREIWKNLEVRERINDNPRIVFGIALACIFMFSLIGLDILLKSKASLEGGRIDLSWYYDLNTRKLFSASKDLIVPAEAPSGPLANGEPAAVSAYVFSYEAEPNDSDCFIGFLAKPSKVLAIGDFDTGSLKWTKGKLIRRVDDKEWVSADSPEGQEILRELFSGDKYGRTARYYLPR